MEQITFTIKRETLEKLPVGVLVTLLAGQVVQPPAIIELPKHEIPKRLVEALDAQVEKHVTESSLFQDHTKTTKAKFWTPSEDKKLLQMYSEGHKTWFLANVFECEKWQVEYRLEKLESGQAKFTKRRWTRKDDLELIYGVSKHHLSEKELSEKLGRSVAAIRMRTNRLKAAGRI